jgi:hypothetical protein
MLTLSNLNTPAASYFLELLDFVLLVKCWALRLGPESEERSPHYFDFLCVSPSPSASLGWNLGYFVGDDTHTKISAEEVLKLQYSAVQKLYEEVRSAKDVNDVCRFLPPKLDQPKVARSRLAKW